MEDPMRIMRVACVAVAAVVLAVASARAQLPWPGPGTEQLPPDPTVPNLPAVAPVICPAGEAACLSTLAEKLRRRTRRSAATTTRCSATTYLTITRALGDATGTPGSSTVPTG
jgi:hypothetical protein